MAGRLARDDYRLGQPTPTGPALNHLCPVCEGKGDTISVECYCKGFGAITADQAWAFAMDTSEPRWSARPLPAVPAFTGRPCADCAFRPDSPEREGATAVELYRRLTKRGEQPFYCHVGMHDGAQGYVPRQRDTGGAPIGHPICAGWIEHYKRALPLASAESVDVDGSD